MATTTERGYGWPHQRARRRLARTLPTPCGYCGVLIRPGEPWVAAHRIDGDPKAGWIVAHPQCNEGAKKRGLAYRAVERHPGLRPERC